MRLPYVLYLLVLVSVLPAAELIIDTDSTVIEGGTYDHIEITARNVTLRNVTVRNTTGKNYYAGIFLHGSKYTTVENCTVDGGASAVRGKGTCGGIKLDGASRAKIIGNTIYNLNDDGIRMYSSSLSDIVGNTIYMLISCGTDGGCSSCDNGHSDGIQAIFCTKVNILNNFIYDVRGTSALFMGNNPNQMCRFITVANNIFFTPEAGYTTYLQYGQDFDVVNNVILGGSFGSIWYGTELYTFRMQNNICGMHKLKGGGTYVPAQHTVTHNLYCELHPYFNLGTGNIIEKDPQFVSAVWNAGSSQGAKPEDFTLKSTSPCRDAGVTDTYIPAMDFFSKGRSGKTDIGAVEYGGVTGIELYSDQAETDGLAVTAQPNPMADHITITVKTETPQRGVSTVSIYDHTGNLIRMFHETVPRPSGRGGFSVSWNGTTVSGQSIKPGMYYYRITDGDNTVSGRIIKTR